MAPTARTEEEAARPNTTGRGLVLEFHDNFAAQHIEGFVLLGMGVASVVKWSQRHRRTGSAAAKPMGSQLKRKLLGERDWLLERIAAKPDLTLRELVRELHERDVAASTFTVAAGDE